MEEQLSLRQKVLTLLYKEFGNLDTIYECADEWCKKQHTTNGVVKYYKAYYNNREIY